MLECACDNYKCLLRSTREVAGQEPSAAWLIEMSAEWRAVFLLAAVVQAGGLTMYLALASGERQAWD
jgi:hypothetical protein